MKEEDKEKRLTLFLLLSSFLSFFFLFFPSFLLFFLSLSHQKK